MAAGGVTAAVAKSLLVVDGATPAAAPSSCFCRPTPPPRSFYSGRKVVPFSEHSRPGRRRGRRSLWSGGGAFLCPMGSSASSSSSSSSSSSQAPDGGLQDAGKSGYASVSDEEWKKRLTKEQYYITRQKGTERAFTGEYWNTKTPGTYHCVCCDMPLFGSKTKFDSGTGWPSYYAPVENNVKSKLDLSIIFMPRQEVLCAVCDAHLGHVFDDGPPPTGKRYCINSASLKLKPQ